MYTLKVQYKDMHDYHWKTIGRDYETRKDAEMEALGMGYDLENVKITVTKLTRSEKRAKRFLK